LHDPHKFTQIAILGLKTYHLATLHTATYACTYVSKEDFMSPEIFERALGCAATLAIDELLQRRLG
jgi:hypothetical protein